MPSLYVHIPFCARKCGYCDFYSEAPSAGDAGRYLSALDAEIGVRLAEWPGARVPDTVFFGGGTPSILTPEQFLRLGEILHRHFDLSRVREWTSEINPNTLTAEKARAMHEIGIRRSSFGVQSFDEGVLKALDRTNESGKLDAAIGHARAAGIENFNLDLIFAVPGQTVATWRRDMEQAFARAPNHIALYALTFEDDTPLTHKMEKGEVDPMPADEQAVLYRETVAGCRARGFERYEVSNFAPAGADSKHNGVYWACGEWLGVGPRSVVTGAGMGSDTVARWANAADYRMYAKALLDEHSDPRSFTEESSGEALADELLLMGLRRAEGVSAAVFAARTGMTVEERCGPSLDELAGLGLIDWDGLRLRLTDEGFLVLDTVVLELSRQSTVLG
jgi:oxygen-independent coproporphyrinogen-3 oxidase